ncbi:MAG: FHA domain-containing protein [Armatimonadetes bacterium]|nr:FHA domain-containing protein [Armatimonadota bacterium]
MSQAAVRAAPRIARRFPGLVAELERVTRERAPELMKTLPARRASSRRIESGRPRSGEARRQPFVGTVKFRHPEFGELLFSIMPDGLVVGRSGGDADVELDGDDKMSRRHGRLWLQDGGVWYEDLGSANGSWIGNQRLTGPIQLCPGHEVRLGDTYLGLSEKLTEKPYHSPDPPIEGTTQRVKSTLIQEILKKAAQEGGPGSTGS